jgi:hypothetical protein
MPNSTKNFMSDNEENPYSDDKLPGSNFGSAKKTN